MFLICFLLLSFSISAQDIFDVIQYTKIPESELSKITENTLNLFKSSLDKLDKVYIDGAIEDLKTATEIQPDFLTAQGILAILAVSKGDSQWGEESKQYYNIAVKAYETILKYDPENSYIKTYLKSVQNKIDRIDQRDEKRIEVGLNFLKKYAPPEKTDEEKAEEEKDKKYTIYTRKDVELPFLEKETQGRRGSPTYAGRGGMGYYEGDAAMMGY